MKHFPGLSLTLQTRWLIPVYCCAQKCERHWVFAKWVRMLQVSQENYKQNIREFQRLSQDHFQFYSSEWEVTVREGVWQIIYKLDWTCTLKGAWNTDAFQWWKTRKRKGIFQNRIQSEKKASLSCTKRTQELNSAKALTRLVRTKSWPTPGLEGQVKDTVNTAQEPDQLAEAR